MLRKWGLPALAGLGIAFGVGVAYWGTRRPPPPPILFPPPVSPYRHAVAGSGVIESSSENIFIGTPFNELVTDVFVEAGDRVEAGAALFQLELRTLLPELEKAIAAAAQAEVEFQNESVRFSFYERLSDRSAVSEEEYQARYYAREAARANLEQALSQVQVNRSLIDRSTVRAPSEGEVLQVNIHKGEIANLNPFTGEPLMIFGPVTPLHIRVDVDEDDAWRVIPGAPARAFVRGNSNLSFPLRFVRIEPFVTPKTALTGDTQERVDTRVLQVIYEFERADLPIYVGQILDVFVEARPLSEAWQ